MRPLHKEQGMPILTKPKVLIPPLDLTKTVATSNAISKDWQLVEAAIDGGELSKLHELEQLVLSAGLESHPGCCGAHDARRAPTLLRFLRARNKSPKHAFGLLAEAVAWRQEFKLDEKIAAWRHEWSMGTSPRARVLHKYNFMVQLGVDREGLPVYVQRCSQGDPGGLAREIGQEVMLVHHLMILEDNFEKAWQMMLKTGKVQFSFIELIDLGDYNLVPQWKRRAWASVPVYKNMAKIFDRYYPERVRIIFFLRTPSAFSVLWRLVLPIVPTDTRRKIKMRGSVSQKWLFELREHMRPEIIPEWLQTESIEAYRRAQPWVGIVPVGALQNMK